MSINANNAALNEILEAINELPEAGSGKEEQEKSIDITENGETVITPDDENTTLSKVTVNVDVPTKEEQEKVVDITENGTTVVTPDEGKALSKVTVNVEVESSGGGEDTLRSLLTNTLIEYTINDEIDLKGVRFASNKLIKFVAPNLTSFDQYTFYLCSNINFLDLGRISNINNTTFSGLHKVETVIFRNTDVVVSLNGAFTNCKSILREDYTYYCYFYVPKALIEDYKVATNWSNYANRFRAIEDYPTIAGGVL